MRQVNFVERTFEEEINGVTYSFDAVAEMHIDHFGDDINEERTTETIKCDIEVFDAYKLDSDGNYIPVTDQEYQEIIGFLTEDNFDI